MSVSIDNNLFQGFFQEVTNYRGNDSIASEVGRITGDTLGALLGVIGIIQGVAMINAGAALTVTSLGTLSPVGGAVAVGGAALVAGSVYVGATSFGNLLNDSKSLMSKIEGRSKGTDNLPDRSEAFNQAKRDASIPRTQQPEKIERVPMRSAEHEGGHVIKDSNGNVIMTREYTFTNTSGEKIIIQDHSAGHLKGGQGPHFNVRPADKPRTGKVEGTKEHYPFK